MKNLKRTAIISLAIPLLCACSKVPRGIIAPHDMAMLLADLHTGEAVVDLNHSTYYNDSLRLTLKQSVYLRHGVSSEQVDSSLAWYGRNIGKYMDVYDETIEILEQRLIESGNRVAGEASLSIAGDSVDVWPNARFITVSERMPSRTLTFSFSRDNNWEPGDVYTWRVKLFNHYGVSQWMLASEYEDGTVEYMSSEITGDGRKEIIFISDSTQQAVRVFGYFVASARRGTEMRMDSIEMIRKRLDPSIYSRRYVVNKVKNFYPRTKTENESDTTSRK
ncbi:MAG: DUF4296 domain-containing protein [Muribaculaceae bacterium]|nr:DUF4296 domain-containing protein [Muribaculaceae bacterium]